MTDESPRMDIFDHCRSIETITNAYETLAQHNHPSNEKIGNILALEIERFTSPTIVLNDPTVS